MPQQRSNFAHLARLQADLAQLGGRAERFFSEDPNTCLIKLRQFAEVMAQEVAARAGLYVADEDNQATLLNRLRQRDWLPRDVADLFHWIRKAGNEATHQMQGTHANALQGLKMAVALGFWYHRSFHDGQFKGGAFIPPSAPVDESAELKKQLDDLRAQMQQADAALKAEAQRSAAAAEQIAQIQADAKVWEELAESSTTEAEALKVRIVELQALQQAAKAQPEVSREFQHAANLAAAQVERDLDEAATRELIDQQLRDAGWEVDSAKLRYANGARPEPGRNRAIAEWPCEGGDRADYALFIGTRLVAVVEAKRKSRDVSGDIEQAKRYARGIIGDGGEVLSAWWQGQYKTPFVYAANGRPFHRQYLQASGIWFCDLRRAQNVRKALESWHSPNGLAELLKQDIDSATSALDDMPMQFDFPLRAYQREAILAVEKAIKAGKQEMLVAMATGTGKTKTCIALVYRLLKAQRFRRILFLVDRNVLGEQAAISFKETRIENMRSFTDIFGIREIDEPEPDTDTMVHIATVQGMVARVFNSEEGGIGVDAYDCIVVDECHRGYALDREMSEAESEHRDQADYISHYRRVLDHFDAVKIGLTATPALHTTQIFGVPVFTYSYREAVLDGYLIDHDPATVITTELSRGGIRYASGDEVLRLNRLTHGVESYNTPDALEFDVSQFNKKVLTEPFNQAVCAELTQHIDPYGPAKTLIFCATDEHADLVVRLLKQAYQDAGFNDVGDDAIIKITGASDKPLLLVRRYKNE
ncbi:MAG: type I restriction-modification system endonuclease, partial [Nevskiaceae bacterium]|nr:type I restriction-modification system endonuclease [Nevskiaceae bacterium]